MGPVKGNPVRQPDGSAVPCGPDQAGVRKQEAPENGSDSVRASKISAIAVLVALLGLIMLYGARRGPAAEDQPRPR